MAFWEVRRYDLINTHPLPCFICNKHLLIRMLLFPSRGLWSWHQRGTLHKLEAWSLQGGTLPFRASCLSLENALPWALLGHPSPRHYDGWWMCSSSSRSRLGSGISGPIKIACIGRSFAWSPVRLFACTVISLLVTPSETELFWTSTNRFSWHWTCPQVEFNQELGECALNNGTAVPP